MANFQPYEQGGVTGGIQAELVRALQGQQVPGIQTAEPPAPAAPAAPAPAGPPALGSNKLSGFTMDKFADPNRSEKYKIGDVFSRYDPKGGITSQLIDELNGLGIAQFSGQGDQLTVNNTKGDPRFGKGGTSDVIKGLKGNNEDTAWQPWFVDDQPQQQAAPQGPQAGWFSTGSLNPMLQGDGGANVQAALSKIQQPGLLQQLLAQLQGGQ